MSSPDAQKSEVHSATEDATTSPTNRTIAPPPAPGADARDALTAPEGPASNFERGAADRDLDIARGSPEAKTSAARPGGADMSGERAEPLDTGPTGPDESDYGGLVVIQTDMDLGNSPKSKA